MLNYSNRFVSFIIRFCQFITKIEVKNCDLASWTLKPKVVSKNQVCSLVRQHFSILWSQKLPITACNQDGVLEQYASHLESNYG